MRVDHDYDRGGALAYLAAYDVHRAYVVGRCEDTTGIEPFARLAAQFPNAIPVRTPAHGSWLNQIEIYFSIVQRKALSPNDFTDLDAIIDRLNALGASYNQYARPFKWKFTTTDLDEPLTRLDCHQREHRPHPAPRRLNAAPTNLRARPLSAADRAALPMN